MVLALAASLGGCGRQGPEAGPASGLERTAKPINEAAFEAEPPAAPPAAKGKAPAKAQAYSPAMLKLEILLDRARFSPGLIDGKFDENLRHALMAYRQSNAIKGDTALDKKVWAKLTMADPRPVMRAYTIDADDVAGPFTPAIPTDLAKLAELDLLGYASPAEELAEAFHMDTALLQALNPGAGFRPGDTILVADRGGDDLGADVARVEVDPVLNLVRAFGVNGSLLATYPATVGSEQASPPRGTWAVDMVAAQPNYDYRSGRVSLGGTVRGAAELAPGPNSPLGVVWIALTDPACGIQGTADPAGVGKPVTRGCVLLTNWDARELARAVKPGTVVTFR